MSTPVLAALVVTLAIAAVAWLLPLPDPGASTTAPVRRPDHALRMALVVLCPAALATATLLAAGPGTDADGPRPLWLVLAVLTAALGGGPVTAAVLRLVPPERVAPGSTSAPPAAVLRGGATIGVLERSAIAVSLLSAWPEGIAVVLAVKGLGRYPELRAETGTSERFIIGTFASVLWALSCAGVVLLAGPT